MHSVAGIFEPQGVTVFWQSKTGVYSSYRNLRGMWAQIISLVGEWFTIEYYNGVKEVFVAFW